jgi:hypothetical protein
VSHQPERKEKNCLNCGTLVQGRYCQACGQENIVPRQNFWSLCWHFVADIFHFDGKFFDTLKYLFFRPGKVPKEYVDGKRMRYLDPIRMYLFTSTIFFLIFFMMKDPRGVIINTGDRYVPRNERFMLSSRLYEQLQRTPGDTLLRHHLALLMDTSKVIVMKTPPAQPAPTDFIVEHNNGRYLLGVEAATEGPGFARDGSKSWVEARLEKRWQEYKKRNEDDPNRMLGDLSEVFMHRLPYLLFLSLPFFALILKLAYVRRKNFYYSDHAVFTLYHYIFSFILLLLLMGLSELKDWSGWRLFNWMVTGLSIAWPVSLYIGMKRFYGQGWLKTLWKFLLVNLLGFITLMALFMLFVLLSTIF